MKPVQGSVFGVVDTEAVGEESSRLALKIGAGIDPDLWNRPPAAASAAQREAVLVVQEQ
ncbi:hypothetical protein [Streptomyces sp. NBC_01262]|uniref:hypothetical protein n=1 Tax=Streptomyces sp. NBC_01262 TaxID=2903803 RepID=UPI002E2F6A11|nr:hypothetical protein [Streptomyces sp. NBC_01262]